MTIHNEANKGDIASTVIMPGDPLRAKYIAENFLKDYKLVNSVRGIFAYTGLYKNKRITVMASGMGMPSMGIYSYELYKFYDVSNIIRIGSCGGFSNELDLLDTILVDNSYTEANFAKSMTGKECHLVESNKELNNVIINTSNILNKKIIIGNIACSECFDPYLDDPSALKNRLPEEYKIIGSEMESFALFYTAKKLNKKAACLLTVSDVVGKNRELSVEERQNSMNDMIILALESAINL